MTRFPQPGGAGRAEHRRDHHSDYPSDGHDRPEYPSGEHDRHHHRGRDRFGRSGRSGRSGREPDLRAMLSDQPIGTTAEALGEAFLGVGQLLRARARSHRGGQRRPAGLTFARAALLAALETDGPQRMGQLAHRLGVVPRTVTPMVDALEDEGLVVREADPDDRRATLLRITEDGVAELSRTRSDRRSAVDEVFAALSDDERSGLAGALEKLRTAARAGLDPAGVAGPSTDGSDPEDRSERHDGFGPQRGRGRGRRRPPHHHSPAHHRRGRFQAGSWEMPSR